MEPSIVIDGPTSHQNRWAAHGFFPVPPLNPILPAGTRDIYGAASVSTDLRTAAKTNIGYRQFRGLSFHEQGAYYGPNGYALLVQHLDNPNMYD